MTVEAGEASECGGKRPKLIAVLGPTASGKSAVAMHLARAVGGEIVSCDSMQVYRELSIGTAKPSRKDRARIPHHLIDCVSISERFDTNRFVRQARAAIVDIWHRQRLPILVGGSGLYAKAMIYGFELQPSDNEIFRIICREADQAAGLKALRAELQEAVGKSDCVSDDTLRNPRRLIRAIEILRITGTYPWHGADGSESDRNDWLRTSQVSQFVLMPPPDELRERIRRRAYAMLDRGWADEARQLVGKGLLDTPTAYQALGYREATEYRGMSPDEREAVAESVTTRTWQYARRQMTWFRRQHPGAAILALRHGVDCECVAEAILTEFRRRA